MKVVLNVWVNPKTMESSDKPIEVVFTTKKALLKLKESGLKYDIVSQDTPARKHNSYAGMCVLCGDLIRSEIDVGYHIFWQKLDKCHRSCLELALIDKE